VSRLPKDQVLVEAVTDDDSVTVSALVVLRPVNAGSLAIEAVHIDFLFVE
jgi:hypothetical protein